MNNSASKANQHQQELQDLLGIISHDLAAPIRHVRGFTELLMGSIPSETPEQVEYKAFVDSALNVLENLLRQMVATSSSMPARTRKVRQAQRFASRYLQHRAPQKAP